MILLFWLQTLGCACWMWVKAFDKTARWVHLIDHDLLSLRARVSNGGKSQACCRSSYIAGDYRTLARYAGSPCQVNLEA